ncbi:MAG: tRNA (adenosine(37)-N6)-threonylcarbamoyltransferase complex ATPase subunit type 1 TsaE [Bacteroidota bacterium]|nr:tRNA (adenosine(37)-N6)-threonylcarbamoyltransferase complex ATPase subunit type 1 TsaE [Bacteroidota bacterium]
MPELDNIQDYSLEELGTIASKIISFAVDLNIWLFVGEMGVGKTTLIKEISQQLGVIDNVHSPTYSLVNEYGLTSGEVLYHFDFYRLKYETEAMDIGVEEYFYSGNKCLIEWPEKIPSLIPEKYLMISISLTDKNQRSIFLSKHDQ